MLRDTGDAASAARNYALRLGGWSLALFGLFRLPWVATQIVPGAPDAMAVTSIADMPLPEKAHELPPSRLLKTPLRRPVP